MYPDSMGGKMENIVSLLRESELRGAISSLYILPSMFHTDLDRGFSVQDYELEETLVKKEDLKQLQELGIDLKLDFILNHASVLSPQFQDLLKNGNRSEYKDFFIDWNQFWDGYGTLNEQGYIEPDEELIKDTQFQDLLKNGNRSEYKDFFIDWNQFWDGYGTLNEQGYIEPDEELIKDMFFRKQGLPILMVEFPDGRFVPYWNTFYQKVWKEHGRTKYLGQMDLNVKSELVWQFYDETLKKLASYGACIDTFYQKVWKEHGRTKYLGQMDLNVKSELVWQFYDETLKKLASYGACIVRLDAFAYTSKEVGARNFFNEPETWEILERLTKLGEQYNLIFLPEIHASYEEKRYEEVAKRGYVTYDFFLPGLIIEALESGNGEYLKKWAEELQTKKIDVVNMLGCHDGIPLLNLRGLLPEERIQSLIDTIVKRGGYVKDLHGKKKVYYQVNATYYSALGESDKKMLLARAIQMFMPGKPQVWYLDLFVGKNDYQAVADAGEGGHKEINRTNLSLDEIKERLTWDVVQKQLELMRLRNSHPAFSETSQMTFLAQNNQIHIMWKKDQFKLTLEADLRTLEWKIY